ncbi:ATP-binding cassette domain-containing protein [Paenibacillus motobuensis]|uniref:ABC transporter ATP-binding protein n=1 Tax=Paenibacillus TaxID=44249 RepID=UPI002040612E|nr:MULTISPECIES: ATP-binding cassette domain-containing protein [Paenibacillus]MCM3039552.1 ATP-binding cassette domain-containing protein [Paenibacillus lutimineralis]MCM3646656.1 ATP-binding cassette domain-containing protein [Paenibacillus motobuensis]
MDYIRVRELHKSFVYYRKEAGLRNSLINLFTRKSLVKEAVKSVSFDIGPGECVGFLGPNGAGKTTTLKMLSGILYPTGGEANVLGYVPWERKNEFKRLFSIVMGQKNQLWWDLPAIESIYLNKCIYDVADDIYRRSLDELSEMLDVQELLNVQVRRLSLGERMKMELIAALIHRPRLLYLDEPTIGLDFPSQKKVREFLKYYNEQFGATILLTSHYMKDVEDLCKRTIIINEGSLLYDGDLHKINDLFGERKIIRLRFSEPVAKLQLAKFGEVVMEDEYNAVLELPKYLLKEVSRAVLDSFPTVDWTIEDVPIEESISMLYHKESVG